MLRDLSPSYANNHFEFINQELNEPLGTRKIVQHPATIAAASMRHHYLHLRRANTRILGVKRSIKSLKVNTIVD